MGIVRYILCEDLFAKSWRPGLNHTCPHPRSVSGLGQLEAVDSSMTKWMRRTRQTDGRAQRVLGGYRTWSTSKTRTSNTLTRTGTVRHVIPGLGTASQRHGLLRSVRTEYPNDGSGHAIKIRLFIICLQVVAVIYLSSFLLLNVLPIYITGWKIKPWLHSQYLLQPLPNLLAITVHGPESAWLDVWQTTMSAHVTGTRHLPH